MDTTTLMIVLALGTLCAVLIFAFASKRNVEIRRENDDAQKSTLAEDAPNRRSD